ncbi:MAG TPA: TlpA disulfide reductase family protein [Kofleriaceae bacterium]|nr:TlpA disulfide reductase family protein [Kofleriaceae bacterium]
MLSLTFAVVFFAALSALNLLLTFGVIRRLREHDEALASEGVARGPISRMLSPGEAPSEFTAVDIDGAALSRDELTAGLVSFFTPDCQPCEARLPEFMRAAEREPSGRAGVLAVVVGDPVDAEPMSRALAPVARVFIEMPGGALTTAFRVSGYPATCRLDRGHIIAVEPDLAEDGRSGRAA